MANKRPKRRRSKNINRLYSKKYKEWIKKVFQRDGFKCIMCGAKKYLQAHHIVRHADSLRGRLLVKNGATLCKKCHEKINGKEDIYAPMLRKIIKANTKQVESKSDE